MQRLRPEIYREQFITNFTIEVDRWQKQIKAEGFGTLEKDEARHLSNAVREELRTAKNRDAILVAIVMDPEADGNVFKSKLQACRRYSAQLEKMVHQITATRQQYEFRLWTPETLAKVGESLYTLDRGTVRSMCITNPGDIMFTVSDGPEISAYNEYMVPVTKKTSYVTVWARNDKKEKKPDDDDEDDEDEVKVGEPEPVWRPFQVAGGNKSLNKPALVMRVARVVCLMLPGPPAIWAAAPPA